MISNRYGTLLREELPDGRVALWHRDQEDPPGTVRGYRQVSAEREEEAVRAMKDELVPFTYAGFGKENVRGPERKLIDHLILQQQHPA